MVPKCPACLLAGLDEALELVARIAAYDVAVQVQQVTQYFPDPPIRGQLPKPGPCPLAARLSLSKRRKDG